MEREITRTLCVFYFYLDCFTVFCCSAQKSSGRSGYPLNLSTHSLNVKTCVVLGKLLTTDRMFNHISFNDCMLPEEGIEILWDTHPYYQVA